VSARVWPAPHRGTGRPPRRSNSCESRRVTGRRRTPRRRHRRFGTIEVTGALNHPDRRRSRWKTPTAMRCARRKPNRLQYLSHHPPSRFRLFRSGAIGLTASLRRAVLRLPSPELAISPFAAAPILRPLGLQLRLFARPDSIPVSRAARPRPRTPPLEWDRPPDPTSLRSTRWGRVVEPTTGLAKPGGTGQSGRPTPFSRRRTRTDAPEGIDRSMKRHARRRSRTANGDVRPSHAPRRHKVVAVVVCPVVHARSLRRSASTLGRVCEACRGKARRAPSGRCQRARATTRPQRRRRRPDPEKRPGGARTPPARHRSRGLPCPVYVPSRPPRPRGVRPLVRRLVAAARTPAPRRRRRPVSLAPSRTSGSRSRSRGKASRPTRSARPFAASPRRTASTSSASTPTCIRAGGTPTPARTSNGSWRRRRAPLRRRPRVPHVALCP
jgi:hypothetical protein